MPVRRVKCDEKKPDCEKCTSTGRKVGHLDLAVHRPVVIYISLLELSSLIFTQCDGYSILYGDPNPTYGRCAVAEPSNSAMIVTPNPTYRTRGNHEERRHFDFFLNRTASQLSGFWDSDFWSCLILRATHHQPAIRHGVLALGSLHERFEAGDSSVLSPIWDKGEGGFALEQYNLAIQHLIKPASKDQQAVDVCLISCMLFACFEVSQFPCLHQIFGEDEDDGAKSDERHLPTDKSLDIARPPWISPFPY